jgi:hypothetical protein
LVHLCFFQRVSHFHSHDHYFFRKWYVSSESLLSNLNASLICHRIKHIFLIIQMFCPGKSLVNLFFDALQNTKGLSLVFWWIFSKWAKSSCCETFYSDFRINKIASKISASIVRCTELKEVYIPTKYEKIVIFPENNLP